MSIADRRALKLQGKRPNVPSGACKIQLPIKDTSEGDPSVLSGAENGARPQSSADAVSFDLVSNGNAHGQNHMMRMPALPNVPLNRTNTCAVGKTNFFQKPQGETSVAGSSQNSSSNPKKAGKKDNGSLHGRWTEEEHRLFLEGMHRFKKDWRSIERHIGTRTCSQIRSHAQKYFMRLEKQHSGGESANYKNSAGLFH